MSVDFPLVGGWHVTIFIGPALIGLLAAAVFAVSLIAKLLTAKVS